MWELSEFAAKDPDTHEAYKNKVIDFLVRRPLFQQERSKQELIAILLSSSSFRIKM